MQPSAMAFANSLAYPSQPACELDRALSAYALAGPRSPEEVFSLWVLQI